MSHLSKDISPLFHDAYIRLREAAREYTNAPEPGAPIPGWSQWLKPDSTYSSAGSARLHHARSAFAARYQEASGALDQSGAPMHARAEARSVINALVAETNAQREINVTVHTDKHNDKRREAAVAARDEAITVRRRATEGLQVALGYEATKVEAEPIPKPSALNPRSMRSNAPIAGPPMIAKESQGLPKLGDHFTGVTVTDRAGNTLWSGEFSGSIRDPKFHKFFEEADTQKIGYVYFNTRRPSGPPPAIGQPMEYDNIITSAHISVLAPR